MKIIFKKLKITGKTLVQRLFITLQLFGENGLANHAAACAYGFLFSVAPMLLLIAFFILVVFEPSPHSITALIGNISFLDIIIDEQWLTSGFFSVSKPGISGVISILSILWAGRILVLSMQRGLKIIFPGEKNRNPVTDTLITLAVEAVVLVFVLTLVFGSQTVIRFFKAFNFFHERSFLYFIAAKIEDRIFPVTALGIVSFFMYLIIPVNTPRTFSAFWGAFFCAFVFGWVSMAMEFILDQSRYNFLYGALGNLIILLVNVYFFFSFFFLGGQLAFVHDSFDALLFSKLRQARIRAMEGGKHSNMANKLFFPVEGNLEKYLCLYKKGEIVFSKGEPGNDVFYLLKGEVEIYLSSLEDGGSTGSVIGEGSFFGEMGLLSENRAATARAKTDISALALPPPVFDEILRYDTSLDRAIIENISTSLKKTNEKIAALTLD